MPLLPLPQPQVLRGAPLLIILLLPLPLLPLPLPQVLRERAKREGEHAQGQVEAIDGEIRSSLRAAVTSTLAARLDAGLGSRSLLKLAPAPAWHGFMK